MIDLAERDSTAVRELVAQITRFALVGALSTGATFGVFFVLRFVVASVPANLLANAVGTVFAAELHKRVTFSGATASGKRMAVQNVVAWAWSSGATAVGLVVLDAMVAQPTYVQETAVMVAMSTLGGAARFVVLRWWVLQPRGVDRGALALTGGGHAARTHKRLPVSAPVYRLPVASRIPISAGSQA